MPNIFVYRISGGRAWQPFIILSIVTGNFLHSKEFYVLPESGATILFGVLMGSVLKLVAHVSSHVDENELIRRHKREIYDNKGTTSRCMSGLARSS